MEKIKSAFTILYLLGSSNNYLSRNEIQIIQDWIQSTFCSPLSFQAHGIIQQMLFLSPFARQQKFDYAAISFKHLTNIDERLDFLCFAVNLLYPCRQLGKSEQYLLESLAECWNIHLPTFLSSSVDHLEPGLCSFSSCNI